MCIRSSQTENRRPYCALADVERGTITVFQWAEAGYTAVVTGERGERLRLPPFDAVELEIGVLIGDDPTD